MSCLRADISLPSMPYLDVTLRRRCEEECGGGGEIWGGDGADVDVRRSTVSAGEIRGEVGRQDKDGEGGWGMEGC